MGSGWVRDGVQALGGRRSARRVGGNSRRAHGSLANLVRPVSVVSPTRGSVASAPYNAAKSAYRVLPAGCKLARRVGSVAGDHQEGEAWLSN